MEGEEIEQYGAIDRLQLVMQPQTDAQPLGRGALGPAGALGYIITHERVETQRPMPSLVP
jgi:hypothetical protein